MPKVSIIMPVYNKENDLQRSIGSVIEQKFQDFELIIVNDGSTDQSDSIIQRIAEQDNRIRVINQSNGGVSKARNSGLAYATGEWIQFLDADDEILPDYLQEAVPIAEENEVDILFSNFIRKAAEEDTSKLISIPVKGKANKEGLYNSFADYQYSTGYFGYLSNKLISRKSLLQSSAHFKEGLRLAEDLEFLVQLYEKSKRYIFWEGISYKYIQSVEGAACSQNIDYESQLEIHLQIKKWFMNSVEYEKYAELVDFKISEYIYCVVYDTYENRQSIKKMCNRLYNNSFLMDSLKKENLKGMNKLILVTLKSHRTYFLYMIMSARTIVRHVYRTIKYLKFREEE